jgi:hypothetical protein
VAIFGVKALDELVQIGSFQRSFLQSEMLICPQVIDPEFLDPRLLAGWFTVEEERVCLDGLCVKNASG